MPTHEQLKAWAPMVAEILGDVEHVTMKAPFTEAVVDPVDAVLDIVAEVSWADDAYVQSLALLLAYDMKKQFPAWYGYGISYAARTL